MLPMNVIRQTGPLRFSGQGHQAERCWWNSCYRSCGCYKATTRHARSPKDGSITPSGVNPRLWKRPEKQNSAMRMSKLTWSGKAGTLVHWPHLLRSTRLPPLEGAGFHIFQIKLGLEWGVRQVRHSSFMQNLRGVSQNSLININNIQCNVFEIKINAKGILWWVKHQNFK